MYYIRIYRVFVRVSLLGTSDGKRDFGGEDSDMR